MTHYIIFAAIIIIIRTELNLAFSVVCRRNLGLVYMQANRLQENIITSVLLFVRGKSHGNGGISFCYFWNIVRRFADQSE
jgi:hypothetical protein